MVRRRWVPLSLHVDAAEQLPQGKDATHAPCKTMKRAARLPLSLRSPTDVTAAPSTASGVPEGGEPPRESLSGRDPQERGGPGCHTSRNWRSVDPPLIGADEVGLFTPEELAQAVWGWLSDPRADWETFTGMPLVQAGVGGAGGHFWKAVCVPGLHLRSSERP